DHDDAVAVLDDLGGVGRAEGARTTRDQAEALRVVLDVVRLVVLPHGAGPGQHRWQIAFLVVGHLPGKVSDPAQVPDTVTAQVDGAIGQAGRGCARCVVVAWRLRGNAAGPGQGQHQGTL